MKKIICEICKKKFFCNSLDIKKCWCFEIPPKLINDKLNNNLNCFTSKKDFVITISKILKTNFKNQFEVFHVQSECDHQRYLTNKLNDLERLSSSIDDYYYYPRKKL